MLSEIKHFIRGKIKPGLSINKSKIVIDIGSGDKPFWRGDVFFDKLDLPTNQRITETGVIQNLGVFIDGDINKTNFKDKAFDFSFCSHLIEHLQRPDLALKEISRISKKGYIECPNGLVESIQPYQSHLWFIYLNSNKLVFVRKSKKIHDVLIKNFPSDKNVWTHFKDPFIRLYWTNKIQFEIIDNLKESEKFYPIDNKSNADTTSRNIYLVIIKLIRLLFYKKKNDLNVSKTRHR